MLTRERLENALNNDVDESEAINIWNNYVDSISGDDRHIYMMYELDEYLDGLSATQVLEAVNDGFDTDDYYFYDSIYGLTSACDLYDIADDRELIEWLMDYPEALQNTSISDILDDDDETEGE